MTLPAGQFIRTASETRTMVTKKAMVHMLLGQPFFSSMVMPMELIETDANGYLPGTAEYIPVMGTDSKRLIFNPNHHLRNMTLPEVIGVLVHEAAHLALAHHLRMGDREPQRWNIACLAEGTQILMADLSTLPIEQVRPGDFVMSPDGPSQVYGNIYSGIKSVISIQHNHGTLYSTNDHPIPTSAGLRKAGEITAEESTLSFSPSGSGRVRDGQLPDHAGFRDRGGHQHALHAHSRVSPAAGPVRQSLHNQTLEHSPNNRHDSHGICIPSGDHRRRRDNFRTSQSTIHGKSVLSATHYGGQHVLSIASMAPGQGIFKPLVREQRRPQLLQNILERLPDGRIALLHPAVFGDQSATRGFSFGAYRDSRQAAIARAVAGTLFRDCANIAGFEPSRIRHSQGTVAVRPVYDLITEKQFVIADGLLVHNCDFEVNNYLTRAGFVLPKGALIDPKWNDTPAEVIYKQLPASQKRSGQGQGQGQSGGQQGGGGQPPLAQDMGKVLCPQNPTTPGAGPTQEQIESMKADLAGRLIQAERVAKRRGNMPGAFSELIHDYIQPKMDWKELLAAFAARVFQTGFTWRRTSTKLLSQGILMPAPEMDGIGALVIGIDTSGSISTNWLRQFAGEVQELVEKHKPLITYVIYCDAKVQRVDEYKPGDTFEFAVTGRGGTRFEPVFEYVEQEGLDVEAIIYFTDMYGSFPARHPAAPTLWISTSGTKFEVPFGEVIEATMGEAAVAA